MDRTELLAAIHATHAELTAAAAALDDDALAGPAPEMEGWTRKDVLAHVERRDEVPGSRHIVQGRLFVRGSGAPTANSGPK